MGTKFNNFFYNEVKNIVENRNLVRFKVIHYFNILINVIFVGRFTYILFARQFPKYSISEYDIFVRIFDFHSSNSDYSFVATFIGLSISTALLEAKLYFSRIDTVTWQMFYDLAVRNMDIYRNSMKSSELQLRHYERTVRIIEAELARHSYIPRPLASLYASCRARGKIWYNLEKLNVKKFQQTRLAIYPEMSIKLRIRLIVALKVANQISCSFIAFLYISFGSFTVYYFLQIVSEYPNWYIPIVVVELTYFSYMVIRVLEILIFQTNLASSSAILFMTYITEANEYLYEILQEVKTGRSRVSMADGLRTFQVKHSLITHQIIYANQEMWGTVLLISMCNHIPNNAYMMFRILNGKGTSLSWTLMWIQILYILITLCFLAAYTRVLHRARENLCSVQRFLTKEVMWMKWKCVVIYELLNSSEKIGITIGPSSTITFRIVFEIVLYYIAFLIFLFKAFLKSDSARNNQPV